MDNNKVIGGIAAVVLLAGVFYFISQRQATEFASDRNTTATQQEATNASSLKALFSRGDSQECTFQSSEDGYTSSGTVYVDSDNRMRGDFTTMGPDGTDNSHMIVMQNDSYIWSNGEAQGLKMTFNPNDTTDDYGGSETDMPNDAINPNENYDFSCKSWRTDNSKFELPPGVEFIEWTMPEVPAMPSSEICNQIPEPGKTECLNALQNPDLEAR